MDLHSHESSDDSSSSTHQVGLLFGAVAATAFLMLLMLFFFWFLETCTRGSDADDQMSSTTATRDGGLPKPLVEQLPAVPFCNSLPLVEKFGDGCSVCLGQFVNDELVRVLPHCAHVFHVECIDMWLCSHTSCPLCRRSVIPQEVKDSTVIDIVDTAEAENGENSVQTEHHNGAAHLESNQVVVSIECKQ